MDKNLLVAQLFLQAQSEGLVDALNSTFGKSVFVSLPFGQKVLNRPIEDMELSARSYNCLKRKTVNSVDNLVDLLSNANSLEAMRGIGAKSIAEIKTKLMCLAYDHMSERQQLEFWTKVVQNGGKTPELQA